MKRTPETENPDKVHENVRESTDGVETAPAAGDAGADPATGLIGNGRGVDPRYISQR